MAHRIEFYFDFVSPYTYLASTQIARIAAAADAEVVYTPFRILELMQMVGNRPTTVECKSKSRYATADLGRWAARYKVKIQPNPKLRSFDYNELRQAALVAIEQGRAAALVHAVLRAVWADTIDLTEKPARIGLLDQAGFDGARLLEQAGQPEYAAKLDETTKAAAERGVFGSPAFFVGEQLFFGNDRLDFLADALQSAA
jgi:2-hydroxychromene-2-carboxylate isomerase